MPKCMGNDIIAEKEVRTVLDELKTAKRIVGIKQLRRALSSGTVRKVFLAEDADPRLTEPLEALCESLGVSCVLVPQMLDLGNACGIDVGAAAAGILR